VRNQRISIEDGRPITVASIEEMINRGASDGAADAALYATGAAPRPAIEAGDVPAVAGIHQNRIDQAAAMTAQRHHAGIAEAHGEVEAASNELAATSLHRTEAEQRVAAAEAACVGFEQTVMAKGDPDFNPTTPPAALETRLADRSTPQDEGDIDPEDAGPEIPAEVRAWRFPLRRDLPPWAAIGLLSLIAGAEFALNARAFQSVREVQWLVLLLAALVGIGLVSLAHRIGTNVRDVLDVPLGSKGRSPAKLVELSVEVPALVLGIVGVATIRSAYFRLVGITIPTLGLVCIQMALAVAAVGVTMASRNQAADESRERHRELEQQTHERNKPRKAELTAQGRLVRAEQTLRTALQSYVNDYTIQVAEVALGMEQYVRSYATAAGVTVSGALPSPAKPLLIVQAERWLASHPVGTLAFLELPYRSSEPDSEEVTAPETASPDATADVTPIGSSRDDESAA
jgi:hypothetical protein